MAKVMLIYPPGRAYQRGEDRCQANVEDSSTASVRACNDLGYASALLRRAGHTVFLRDYQTEKKGREELLADFTRFRPDALFLSITNATIFEDLSLVEALKQAAPELMIMLKGALFFDPDQELLEQLDLSHVDYLIGGESDFMVDQLVTAHFRQDPPLESIRGILFRKDQQWQRTSFAEWETDLDVYPFPDRTRMPNHLYVRPDTGEPQATIATSRGCPASCIYCLTPRISGKRLRLRSSHAIVAELMECYQHHGIRDFFFKSDTFTYDPAWVKDLCERILRSPLAGKIRWVANSRVKPLALETLEHMKAAGCWLVAFGYESGSRETLVKIKKGSRLEDNLQAARFAKKAGLQTLGFFLIGLPWEDWTHLEATRQHMLALNPDFVEVHLALPFYGTELYSLARTERLIDETVLGRDYFQAPPIGTHYLSRTQLHVFRTQILRAFYTRPSYLLRKILAAGGLRVLKNYLSYGLKLFSGMAGTASVLGCK